MLKKLNVKLNHDNVIIQCNNQQMLHLMTAEIDKSFHAESLKIDLIIETLVLVKLDLLQDFIIMSVRL